MLFTLMFGLQVEYSRYLTASHQLWRIDRLGISRSQREEGCRLKEWRDWKMITGRAQRYLVSLWLKDTENCWDGHGKEKEA